FLVASIVRRLQGELLQGRELALDAVEPGAVRGGQVEADVVRLGPRQEGGRDVGAVVVHDDVELLRTRVTRTDPSEERQEVLRFLVLGDTAVEAVGFQVIEGEEMANAPLAGIRRRQALDPFPMTLEAMAMTRQQIEGAEFVDAQASAIRRPLSIKTSNRPIFLGEQGI